MRAAGALRAQPRRSSRRSRARPPTPRGSGRSCRNPFKSIVVRCVEILYALDEALRLIAAYEPPDPPAVEVAPRAGDRPRLERGAARDALAPLRDRRRGHDPRREDRPADLAEPGPHRGEPARLRRSATPRCPTTSCGCAASRRSAATTRASPARRTSCGSRSTAGDARHRRRQPRGAATTRAGLARRATRGRRRRATRATRRGARRPAGRASDARRRRRRRARRARRRAPCAASTRATAPLPARALRSSTHAFGVADAIELARVLGAPAGARRGLRDRGRRLLGRAWADAGRRARRPRAASPTARAARCQHAPASTVRVLSADTPDALDVVAQARRRGAATRAGAELRDRRRRVGVPHVAGARARRGPRRGVGTCGTSSRTPPRARPASSRQPPRALDGLGDVGDAPAAPGRTRSGTAAGGPPRRLPTAPSGRRRARLRLVPDRRRLDHEAPAGTRDPSAEW